MTRTTTSRADSASSELASTTNTKGGPMAKPDDTRTIELELPRFHPAEAEFLARVVLRIGFAIYHAYDEEILSLNSRVPPNDIPF